jgi:hypothetical protein
MPDFSQHHIKSQIAKWLIKRKRDPELIHKLNEQGFCRGFTTLNLYAKWLQTQPIRYDPNGRPIPRDDFTWLTHALTVISTWDTSKELGPDEEECFELALAKINAHQHVCGLQDFSVQQSNLNLYFSDTRNRKCILDYHFAARFTPKELHECLSDLLPENKLIFVSSDEHSMGIFRHDETISYIDPNLKKGMVDLPPLPDIPEHIRKEVDAKFINFIKLAALPMLLFTGGGYSDRAWQI